MSETLIGKRYGLLLVLLESKIQKKNAKRHYALCKCDCGTIKRVRIDSLKAGRVVSCGCKRGTIHGMRNTRFYGIWDNMNQRCGNPNATGFEYYGGRGLVVCEKWKSFLGFKEDMYESYEAHAAEHGEKNTSIDRINNDDGYHIDNCRWATNSKQSRNQRVGSNNSTGYRGVSINSAKGKYFASIELDGQRKSLGYYDELIDAVKARRAAEAFYYGTVQINGHAYELGLLANGAYAREMD